MKSYIKINSIGKNMKKNLLLYFVLFCLTLPFFAEKPVDFTVTFEPTLIINTDKPEDSAPSPVVYPLSFGVIFPKETLISFQPRISFFTNYYLWNGKGAYPAEIENRTATAFSFLIDLPIGFTFTPGEKHKITLGTGPSILARFAFLSHAVSGSDSGYGDNTASDDVSKINEAFWNDASFLFINMYSSYLYKFSEKISAGPETHFYLPIGSLACGNGMNSAMISMGIIARF